MGAVELGDWLERARLAVAAWEDSYGGRSAHPASEVADEDFAVAFDRFSDRLRDNYPFFHPTYAGQMLKPPHPAAVVGYLTAMLINPNNHALDGGPATAAMEREVVGALATMFGYGTHLGHLTSSGTIANLEALFVARELHPGKGIAYSVEAHYTHGRMCHLLGMPGYPVPVDAAGRMDLDALSTVLADGQIGTVVLTAGTTGLGAVDRIDEALALRDRYGVRLHVDAAYGGFFTLLPSLPAAGALQAIGSCDSVVVDPHKHGLQPYGCGAVLFADPGVGRLYQHDSPYTYFTSDELHLGEISLECSRAGASAAALWLTFQVLPPATDGLGAVLAADRRAAVRLAELIASSPALELFQEPELDIVTYLPKRESLSAVDTASASMLARGMDQGQIFLSTLRASADSFVRRGFGHQIDATGARILRSVLMKPESELWTEELHRRLEALCGAETKP